MAKLSRDFRSWQLEKLADPQRAASYLNATLRESPNLFLNALEKVAEANRTERSSSPVAHENPSLEAVLSEGGKPAIEALTGTLNAFGLRLWIEPISGDAGSTTAR